MKRTYLGMIDADNLAVDHERRALKVQCLPQKIAGVGKSLRLLLEISRKDPDALALLIVDLRPLSIVFVLAKECPMGLHELRCILNPLGGLGCKRERERERERKSVRKTREKRGTRGTYQAWEQSEFPASQRSGLQCSQYPLTPGQDRGPQYLGTACHTSNE